MTTPTEPGGRRPRSVFERGVEPDARFSLANERTFLAWIGTSLALLSVGVGLDTLALSIEPRLRVAASIVLILTGAGCAVQAWFGWVKVEIALREQRPLPSPSLANLLPAVLVLVAALVIVGSLL